VDPSAFFARSPSIAYPDTPPLYFGERSPQWPRVRAAHLIAHPACEVCGHRRDLEVHHVQPYHLAPKLELTPSNLLTLGARCPTGNHHLLFGHLGDWSCVNRYARRDAAAWLRKILGRRAPAGVVIVT